MYDDLTREDMQDSVDAGMMLYHTGCFKIVTFHVVTVVV